MIGFFISNLHWKLASLLIAFGLWMVLVQEPELVTSHSVPVFFKDLQRDMEIGSDVPDRVHIEIRGPSGKLTPDMLAETAVLLDLSAVQSVGERTFTVNDASLNLPVGVKFLRAVPSQVRLRFDRVLSKDVKVQVRIGNPQPPGYKVTGHRVQPETLRITGPETRVRQIEAAQTDPIDLGTVFSESEFRVHAYVSDPQVRFEGTPVVTVRMFVTRIHSESR
jgi:YbbR domain-containing protein